jgi:hypothetical protein
MTPQQRLLAKAERLHAIWRKWHLKSCSDYPKGKCCPDCHASACLEVTEVGKGIAYVCCAKAAALLPTEGISRQAAYGREVKAGIRDVQTPPSQKAEIARLPDGILKRWLKGKAAR